MLICFSILCQFIFNQLRGIRSGASAWSTDFLLVLVHQYKPVCTCLLFTGRWGLSLGNCCFTIKEKKQLCSRIRKYSTLQFIPLQSKLKDLNDAIIEKYRTLQSIALRLKQYSCAVSKQYGTLCENKEYYKRFKYRKYVTAFFLPENKKKEYIHACTYYKCLK